MAKSKDLSPQDAGKKIMEMTSPDEIKTFIEGETRRSILKNADVRIKELSALRSQPSAPKQGEQKDPITQKTSNFKGGVEGAKGAEPSTPRNFVTIEDVINEQRKRGRQI